MSCSDLYKFLFRTIQGENIVRLIKVFFKKWPIPTSEEKKFRDICATKIVSKAVSYSDDKSELLFLSLK